MKLIQLTDLHLTEPGTLLYGLDPYTRFDVCLAHVDRYHQDAALLIITGDIADGGNRSAYAWLRDRVAEMRMPVRLLVGNEDDRDCFAETFGGLNDGFIQHYLDTPSGRLVFLDTLESGRLSGRLCADRLAWLKNVAVGAGGADLFVFMHHPPFHVGVPPLDELALADMDTFWKAVASSNMRHVFAGHTHIEFRGEGRSTAWPIAHRIAVSNDREIGPVTNAPPAYEVIILHPDGIDQDSIDVLSA